MCTMAGETQQMHSVKELDAESKQQDEGTALEQQSDKTTKASSEHFSSRGTEATLSTGGAKAEKLEKDKDCPQQREAVIRPQQTGKIDFSSLQNRKKFVTDRTWSSGKGSPQSPSGKGRSREKGKRSGKTERGNPQQLYRLSITNPRTIGIAYPQQKVLPPKKLEPSRGPVSGSYRLNVPTMPEREVELQQQELSYSRYFQENPSSITSTSYTSQALGSSSGPSSHSHPSLSQQQQQASMDTNSTQPGSQLMMAECPLSGSNVWQSPERTYNGSNYGISSQKSTALSETGKTSAFVPPKFQYGYHLLEQSTPDSFACDQNPQPQITHNAFSFSPGNGQNTSQNSSQFSADHQPDRSSYPNPQQAQFIQGVASSIQCSRTLSEDSPGSDSSGSSSQQSEQGKTALPESSDTSSQADCQDAAVTSGSNRNCHPKDAAASQRTLIQAGVQARNISQSPGSPMHFPNRTFSNPPANSIRTGSTVFDKSINSKVVSRLAHSWEGPDKTYSAADQNTNQYSVMNEKFQFQNQTHIDHRPNSSKSNRMPWQQIRPNSAMPNQKLAYMVSPSDWQDESKGHKHNSFQSSRSGDVLSNQRHETIKHNSTTSTISAFKLEMNHAQLCEAKNKSVYYGLNQTIPTAPSRNYSYPPLQIPPLGLSKVSPYESPLPSPVHNPASSGTCSSLSPASTSPVNISSEDSQVSKSAPPHLFYQPPQVKTQLQLDHMNMHSHQFHSNAPQSLPYTPDRAKDEAMSYLQNSTHPKAAMDSNKGYVDSFGVEHHQPPPPYSAHPLLASSLATANLDQLDVLLTCKQCDQNFSNLASFLGHKQYCALNALAQNELKDLSKMEDNRKFHAEPVKAALPVSNTSFSRCPSDLHLSLLGLNKNGELISDSEAKGDGKEDPLKLGLFSGPSNLPVPLPELEMEDAKLDSLITEALNGLVYQSDNVEIDSSFIDAFVDDDLTTVKSSSNKLCLKTKESALPESKNKQGADEISFAQEKCYDSDAESKEKMATSLQEDEKINIKKDGSHKNSKIASREKAWEQESKVKETRKLCKREDKNTSPQRFLLSGKFSDHCGLKSFQDRPALRGSAALQASTSPTSRAAAKESKRKSTGGGTWSKELIHKIVQQKNKLHKLHVKGSKNLQFSLVMERLTPTAQNPAFGEYDYVSDSDDECEPVKIASQGRLNQSSRCKYTYTKQCKWRARSEREQAAWRHESKECFEMKKSEELSLTPEKHQRLRRRGSRSSTSSDLSTSVSPKSTDRTDSDSERKKDSPEQKSRDRSTSQKLFKESSTLALTFTKSVKKYNIDKTKYSENKGIAEDPEKCSNQEVPDLLASPQKVREAVKNSEKRGSSQAKSRDKLVPQKTESSSDVNTLQRIDKPNSEEGPTRCSSTDNKTLEVESPPHAITGEADLNVDRNTKDKTGREPKAAQLRLSGSATLEKQSESVCMVKEAIILVSDLDGHRPTSFCASLIDEVCLSPTGSQSPLIQKDALDLMPYPMDQEQGLIKSPLSFDTSSMFGDLAGFDSGLYSEIPIQKDSFHSVESSADKKEAFVSSFSPFMEPRDWNLMVNPVLRDEISQYKGISEKSNEKKPDYSHISSSLPEKIIDYSANLSSCASEDELEIKRIVNELENQLQTTKLESPPLLIQEASKQLQMSKFSPLRGADNSEREGNRLNIKCSAQTINCSEPFTDPELPWSSTFQFDLIGENHRPHTQVHSEAAALKHEHLHHDKTLGQSTVENEAPAETKEDILEQRRYTENLMKSLEVISDSIFQKEPIISEHKEPNINSPTSQQHVEAECQAPDGAGREDCCEKEAITAKESISSLPNISEQKDEIEIILDESKSSVPNDADPSFGGKQPVSLQNRGTTEIEYHDADTRVASDVKSARCSASSEGDDLNQLIKRNSDCRKNCEEPAAAEEITHQPEGHPSSPAPADPTQEIGKKMADVIKAALEQQYANDSNNPKGISSSQAAESKVGEIMETSTQGNLIAISASESSSPSNAYTKLNMSLEIVNKDKPCSPELVKTNPEKCCSPFHDTQSAEGQSNQLILSQSDGIIDGNACKVTPFNEPLKTDMGLIFAKQEEILNVQDIKEHFPVDFMASQQNSPCREAAEESCCVFLGSVSPASPLLLIAHQTPTEKFDSKGDLNAKRKFSNECIVQCCQNPKSPIIKDCKEAVNSDSLKTAAEMDCSLISTAQMDCRMIPASETVSSSPVPASHTAEPPKVKEDEKGDLMYDLKLSPLNYNDLSDEPPQLNQYNYIPISPASKSEEDLDTKQRPTESCESCDLSVNPALIFNQTDTEATIPLGSDPEATLQPSDEPLVLQQSIKFACFSLGLKPDIPKTDSSGDNPKISLQVFHDPVQPVQDVRIQADLLTEAASVNLDSHKASFEDCAFPKKAEPLIACENEKVPLPPEKQLTLERGPCSAGQQTHKETTHKKSPSSDPPGKVLCEICFMCFRSVPGLKRHKAMKHVVRAEKCSQSTTSSHQGTVLIYEAPVNKQKDDSQRCFPTTKIDGLPEISGSLTSKTAEMESILEEKATEINSMAADEMSHQNPPLQTKAKKNNKGRKNKSSEPNPDPFSDELLKILKTDILQAITPEFKSSALQEQSKSPEGKICDRTVARTEEFLHRATADPAFNSNTQTPEPNTLSETVEHDQFGETKVTEMVYLETCIERNVERTSIENEIVGDYDETEQKGSENSLALEILRNVSTDMKCPSDNLNPLSCLNSSSPSPPGMNSDLKAILDDDTTFSQLFPRDEEAKRKKCPRVYSKRHKKQKLSIPLDVAADYLPTDTFMQNKDQCGEPQSVQTISDQQSNRCEYETISIDDTIMLNMCHNSTLKADGKPTPDVKQNDQQDVCELGNNLLNPLESTVNKSTVEWSSSSDFTGFKSCPIVTSESSDSKHEEPLPAAPCTVEPHAAEGAQSFQTIDIQNINTTFQLPEIQFLASEKDAQVAPLPEAADMDGKEDEKSKKETERRGRKRQDGGMKVKDKQYKCKVCFTWFLTLGELNFHKLSHNPSPPPTCYMCVQRKFSSREQLRDHLREKHAKNKTGIWTCGMCLKEISDVWMYNEHLREHATQFARRGQAQGSMLGISGCFMQETAVKNFISSIMQQRPSKANRESSKATKDQEKAATGFGKFSEGAETKANKTKSGSGGGGKQSTLTPIEVLHKTETPKSVEMHPNCKDPSRDCHHCGKQFPKPFKLQRHLVVHNLERIFLCHKCPISYQEAQELKEHLRRAHEEVDDLDSKHTTLYTCELCADVMHVIKKSFICSTCNYTFSKKEQFDRHMEKHLSGGNKIFKFRGVLRPVKASASKENECDSPVSKRIRLLSDSLPENSSDSGIASFSSLHLNQNALSLKPCVSTADDSTQTIPNEYQGDSSNANVKTEDVTADCSQLLEDLENCIHLSSSGSTTPKKEKSDVTVLPHLDKEANGKSIPESCDIKEENESVCIRTEATSCSVSKESSMAGKEEVVKDKTDLPPAVLENSSVCSTENQIFLQTPESAELAVDEVNQQGDDEQRRCTLSCNDTKQQALSRGAEQESCSQMKNSAAPATTPENTKTTAGAGCAKAMEATATPQHKVSLLASATTDDKDLVKPQKRRKDMKSTNIMQRVSSSVTQENYAVDPKPKKKFRPSKCANPSLQRKSDASNEYTVLSSVRDDVVSNKIISKCKNVNLSLQARRGLLESCAPKNADTITPQNGELKAKRGPLGRSVHMSKVPSVPMNNSLNKPRTKIGVRTVDSNSFRTAESQNHILSQLFGQKLTSFKIPLRKDTSESIN